MFLWLSSRQFRFEPVLIFASKVGIIDFAAFELKVGQGATGIRI